MGYLPDKNNNKTPPASQTVTTVRIAPKNLPGPAPNNVLRMLQISSKSVYFRRSYSRTRESHQIDQESESSIRQKPSFEPNNKAK